MLRRRTLVAGLTLQKPAFNTRSDHEGCVVHKVPFGHAFLKNWPTSIFACQYHSINARYSFVCHRRFIPLAGDSAFKWHMQHLKHDRRCTCNVIPTCSRNFESCESFPDGQPTSSPVVMHLSLFTTVNANILENYTTAIKDLLHFSEGRIYKSTLNLSFYI